ncbi:MAG TPA: hypothetical protein VFU46_07065 [Gemmatimonadales bacterium]|nr:hypothetical protein [Gemmatimonadales bacterium]
MRIALVALLGLALAGFTYLYLERLGRRGLVPLGFRALSWTALGLLLLNLGCPVAEPPGRPIVLLDGSLSLTAPGGRWAEARDSAERWGDVRLFGDERPGGDTVPDRGRSLLGPALGAASASGRPVIVVSDGEIEDAADLPRDLLAGSSVRVLPRAPAPDFAVAAIAAPARVTSGDSLVVEADVAALAGAAADSVTVALDWSQGRLARRRVRLGPGGSARVRLHATTAGLPPGGQVLRVTLPDAGDAERRTDERLHLVTIVPTPGVVLLAAPGDWDSRFLYRALMDVAQLPVRGYVRLEPGRWRSMRDLSAASDEQVRQAARRADLLILKGEPPAGVEGGRARGVWEWPSGETGVAPARGDWYLTPATGSPLDAAFAGLPVDSFPPAVQLVPERAPGEVWVALTAQNGRRGPVWPAVTGRDEGRVRRVTVRTDGLWRWAFRGAASEQAYRAWVAATVSWLLAGADSAQGVARPVRAVVQQGRPVTFEWVAGGAPRATALYWAGAPPGSPDTLRFDGAGRAAVWLPPGTYRYRLAAGGGGTVAVEQYSDELLPRPVTLEGRAAVASRTRAQRSARDLPWLFLACVLGLSGEWIARRRMGLR